MYNAIVTPYMENDKLMIKLSSEIAEPEIFYTFDNTAPDKFSAKYTEPLSIPKDATRIRVVTYLNGKQSGKVISLTIEELMEEAKKKK